MFGEIFGVGRVLGLDSEGLGWVLLSSGGVEFGSDVLQRSDLLSALILFDFPAMGSTPKKPGKHLCILTGPQDGMEGTDLVIFFQL